MVLEKKLSVRLPGPVDERIRRVAEVEDRKPSAVARRLLVAMVGPVVKEE